MPVNHTDPAELLAVVDSNDNEIGAERRDIIHRDHLLHRAIHLFVFNPQGDLLLQQRSEKKDRFPLHWECVGGHLGPGEPYDDCVVREAAEELGLVDIRPIEISKLVAGPATDFEFITVYRTVTNQAITPDPNEVIDTKWLSVDEWSIEIAERKRLFSPTLLHSIEHSDILKGA